MAKQTIDIGSAPNDGTGDTLRSSFDKCNDNFDELYAKAYGWVYVTGGGTAQSSIGTTPTKFTGFAANGAASNTTPDHTNDQVAVTNAGVYHVMCQVTFSGSVSTVFDFVVRVGGVATDLAFSRTLGTGGDVGSASCTGMLNLSASDIVTVYVNADGASKSITATESQLTLVQVS